MNTEMERISASTDGAAALAAMPAGHRFVEVFFKPYGRRGDPTYGFDWIAVPEASQAISWRQQVPATEQERDMVYWQSSAYVWDVAEQIWRRPKFRQAPSGRWYHIEDVRYMSKRDREVNGID